MASNYSTDSNDPKSPWYGNPGWVDPDTGQGNPDAPKPTVDPNTGAPKQSALNPKAPTAEDLTGWYKGAFDRAPSATEIAGWSNGTFTDPAADPDYIKNQIYTSGEAKAYAAAHPPPPSNGGGPPVAGPAIPGGGTPGSGTINSPYSGQTSELIDLLMKRAKGSLNIDPNTDPIIRPQVDNYAATQERSRRNYLNTLAESSSPYATGAQATAKTQTSEAAGQNNANFQASLVANELTSRRNEIQAALSEAGSMLTSQQQMALQHELGTINAALQQQQLTSNNDQFTAQLGLNAENQSNYWDAIRKGLL